MKTKDKKGSLFHRLKAFSWFLIFLWTGCIIASLLWNLHEQRMKFLEIAHNSAYLTFERDVIYRKWAANQGGVYVPVSEHTPPNPYLSVPNRDLTTSSGLALTLVNPAYMVRQVNQMAAAIHASQSHLTSLKPIRPENNPDPWETVALESFERGIKEVASVEKVAGIDHMRLMRPFLIEKDCLKCHAVQGYKEGDIRGGISVSIPMEPLYAIEKPLITRISLAHLLLWFIGVAGIMISKKRLDKQIFARETVEEELSESDERFFKAFHAGPAAMFISRLSDGRFFDANASFLSLFEFDREEVIGRTTTEVNLFVEPDERASLLRILDVRGGIQNYETTSRTKSGKLIRVLFSTQKISLKGQDCTVSTIIDVTERRNAEEAQQRSEARFRLLSETASRLLATDDPQGIVDELCRKVMTYLDCQVFINFLVEETTDRLHLNAYAGIPEEDARTIEWLDYGEAVSGCVARDQTRIIAEDIFHTPDSGTALIKVYGIQAYCCHPLMAQGRLIGTLSFGTKTRPCFTPEEVDLMRTVSDQVAMAMERIQTQEALQQHALELQRLTETLEEKVLERTTELANLSKELVMAQEKERRQISYDLHDNVWQTLVAIRFDIENFFSRQDKPDRADFENKSKKLKKDILEAVGKIRSMQGDLWPYVLDDIGILATLDWYCREFEKSNASVTVERWVDLAEEDVPAPIKIVIYRIMQEALNNALQHSRANHITLCLNRIDQQMTFTVEDNGIGFDLEETMTKRSPWGGLGLQSIKARTELSGGFFRVESTIGKGTIIRASWDI